MPSWFCCRSGKREGSHRWIHQWLFRLRMFEVGTKRLLDSQRYHQFRQIVSHSGLHGTDQLHFQKEGEGAKPLVGLR